MIKVTYIGHSGFAVELEEAVLIFDYYEGELPAFDRRKKVYVFSSHRHPDHFQPEIFYWQRIFPDIQYILSADIPKKRVKTERVSYMRREQDIIVDAVRVHTLRSTDIGVAFLVQCEGDVIYHAGDLNWWHWEEKSDVYNLDMKERYQHEISKMEGMKIDLAFVPVDGRLGEQYDWGIDYFMRHTECACVFPMHFWGDYGICRRLQEEEKTREYRERLRVIERPGQTFTV